MAAGTMSSSDKGQSLQIFFFDIIEVFVFSLFLYLYLFVLRLLFLCLSINIDKLFVDKLCFKMIPDPGKKCD